MPVLRSGARRGGCAPTLLPVDRSSRNTRAWTAAKHNNPGTAGDAAGVSRRGRSRALASAPRGRKRVRAATGRLVFIEEEERKEGDQFKEVVVFEEETKGKGTVRLAEEEKEKEPMGDDNGGLSANRVAGQEEEGNTTPFPEKLLPFLPALLLFIVV